jgi:hypothetical protein
MSNNQNPWVVPPPKHEPLPVGAHYARFKGVEDYDLKGEPKWRFTWVVVAGPLVGREGTALTDQKLSGLPRSLTEGLLNRPLVTGDDVRQAVLECVGRTYLITVQVGSQGGKPAVRGVSLPPQQ